MHMTYLLLSQALDGPPIGAPDAPMPTPNTPQSVDLPTESITNLSQNPGLLLLIFSFAILFFVIVPAAIQMHMTRKKLAQQLENGRKGAAENPHGLEDFSAFGARPMSRREIQTAWTEALEDWAYLERQYADVEFNPMTMLRIPLMRLPEHSEKTAAYHVARAKALEVVELDPPTDEKTLRQRAEVIDAAEAAFHDAMAHAEKVGTETLPAGQRARMRRAKALINRAAQAVNDNERNGDIRAAKKLLEELLPKGSEVSEEAISAAVDQTIAEIAAREATLAITAGDAIDKIDADSTANIEKV